MTRVDSECGLVEEASTTVLVAWFDKDSWSSLSRLELTIVFTADCLKCSYWSGSTAMMRASSGWTLLYRQRPDWGCKLLSASHVRRHQQSRSEGSQSNVEGEVESLSSWPQSLKHQVWNGDQLLVQSHFPWHRPFGNGHGLPPFHGYMANGISAQTFQYLAGRYRRKGLTIRTTPWSSSSATVAVKRPSPNWP